jgi:hypothetical protein
VANVDVDARHMDTDARPRRRAVAIDDDGIVMLDAFLHAGAAIANFFANPFGARRLRHRKHRCRRYAGEQSYVPHVLPPIENFGHNLGAAHFVPDRIVVSETMRAGYLTVSDTATTLL